MKLKTALIAATALAAATTTTASMADDSLKFDGAYGGIEAGLDWTKLKGDSKRDKSLYYGGILGYRVQADSGLVFGLEGTFGDSGYKNETTGINISREFGGSLIFGSAFGEDGANLIYGKVGYVRAKFKEEIGSINRSYNDGGWRLGAGYERSISDNLGLRFGVDYTKYSKDDKQLQGKAAVIIKF